MKLRPLLTGIGIGYGVILVLAVFGVGSLAEYGSPLVYVVLVLCLIVLALHVAVVVTCRSLLSGVAAFGSVLFLLWWTLLALSKVTGDSL